MELRHLDRNQGRSLVRRRARSLGQLVLFPGAPGACGGRSREPVTMLDVATALFRSDRSAEHWDAGQPLRDDSVTTQLRRFVPASIPITAWSRIEPIVRSAAAAAAQTPYRAKTIASVVSQLAYWCERDGLPVTDDVVFHPDVIDRFLAEGCGHLTGGTKANYQSQLRRVGALVVGPPLYPATRTRHPGSPPVQPYSDAEVASLAGWIRGLPTPLMRENATVLLALGLGAGLTSQEVNSLIGSDVEIDGFGAIVHITARPPHRTVPVRRDWEREVASAAEAAGDGPVFLSGRTRVNRKDISRFIERLPRSDAPKLNMHRLRATWIVEHLSARTPLRFLEKAAGASATQLVGYVAHAATPDPALYRDTLRGV